ncbi:hypothetical protein [Streptomyces luteireticuli]|uniref:Uncharacterized protein n=1 Tax=Streptomyces luteireticuli TaxID=173858 RepID=A0ABP3IJM0_9ACTN
MGTTTRSTHAPAGYRITVELADDIDDRFPQLDPTERAGLDEPVVLVVELKGRGLNVHQLAHELRPLRQPKAVVTRRSPSHGNMARILDRTHLVELLTETAELSRMLRLERAVV